jgi:hypothetical protein
MLECFPKAFQSAVLSALARTALAAPLQFPDDPPLMRNTMILEFNSKDRPA